MRLAGTEGRYRDRIRYITKSPPTQNFGSHLRSCTNVGDLKKRIKLIVNQLGYSDYAFLHTENGSLVGRGGLITLPDDYLQRYKSEGMHQHDVIVEYARENNRPTFSSLIYDYLNDAMFESKVICVNRDIRALNNAFGFYESYVIPMTACDGNGKLFFSVYQQNTKAVDFRSKTVHLASSLKCLAEDINSLLHKKFPSYLYFLEREENEGDTLEMEIKSKPLRVLATLANSDMTITQVADKLCISPVTAHQHIAAMRKVLGAKTNISAIKKAIKLGLIIYE